MEALFQGVSDGNLIIAAHIHVPGNIIRFGKPIHTGGNFLRETYQFKWILFILYGEIFCWTSSGKFIWYLDMCDVPRPQFGGKI